MPSELSVPQNLSKNSPAEILTWVNGHCHYPPVWVSEPSVTSSLTDKLKAKSLKCPNNFRRC